MPKSASDDSKTTRCIWTTSDDALLVSVLRQHKEQLGNQSGAGWKPQVWQAVSEKLQAEGSTRGAVKTSSKCNDHWTNLKRNFLEVYAIRNASGFGWDEATQTCTAAPHVWDAYIAAHSNARRWKTTPFPLYDEIHFLVNGIVATGAGVFHPGCSMSPTATEISIEIEMSQETTVKSSSSSFSGFLYDSVAQEIAQLDPDNEPKTPISRPRSLKHERAQSEPPSPGMSASQRPVKSGKRHRRTQADIITEGIGSAIRDLSRSLAAGSGVPTPERRGLAIDLLSQDAAFSSEEEGDLITLFADNMNYADTYYMTKKKDARVRFAQKILKKHGEN